MKKKKIFITFATIVFVVFLIYCGYDRWPTQKWREYRSLVRLWPRLKKEKIESISFCDAPYSEIAKGEEESLFSSFKEEIVETYGFRTRDENDVKSWRVIFEIPKENLQECIKLIDKAMKGAKLSWPFLGPTCLMIWQERMLIVTDRGKYIVDHVEAHFSKVDRAKVFGDEWESYELGEFLSKKCGLGPIN